LTFFFVFLIVEELFCRFFCFFVVAVSLLYLAVFRALSGFF